MGQDFPTGAFLCAGSPPPVATGRDITGIPAGVFPVFSTPTFTPTNTPPAVRACMVRKCRHETTAGGAWTNIFRYHLKKIGAGGKHEMKVSNVYDIIRKA